MSRYYRSSFGSFGPGGITPAVKTLIIICVAGFVLQMVGGLSVGRLGLIPSDVIYHLALWQLVTYIFLHGDIFHILFNMLGLWMFGTDLERLWGTKAFARCFFICGIGGAVFKTLLSPGALQVTIGASGAVLGLLVAYAVLFPERIIILYIFPIKVKWFAIGYAALTVFSSVTGGGSTDYLVHLGGMLCGFLFMKGGRLFTDLKWRYDKWKRDRLRKKFEVYYNDRHRENDERFKRWKN